MDFKIKLKYITYIPIFLLFLPDFAIWIPQLGGTYLYFFPVLYFSLFVCLFFNPIFFIRKIYTVIKETPLKYFFLFLLFASVDSIFLSLQGGSIAKTIRGIIMQFGLYIIPILLYFIYIVDKYISFNNFIKLFVSLIWGTLILGIVAYIGQIFDIGLINNLFDFFANTRLIDINDYYRNIGFDLSNYKSFGMPRLDCLHQEPSFYARWLFLFLPFAYCFSMLKSKFFRKNLFDKIFKMSFIPLLWLNIILTFSPIYLILCMLVTFIYYIKALLKFIKNNFVFVWFIFLFALLFFVLVIQFYEIDLSETYLSRITNIFTQVRSFEDFINIESSLATRIASFINLFIVFLKHPFLGVGLGNLGKELLQVLPTSPVPLTGELVGKYYLAINNNVTFSFNNSLFLEIITQYGVFGCLIYLYYCFNTICQLNHNSKVIDETSESCLFCSIQSIKKSFINLLIIMFYSSGLMRVEICFIFVLSTIIIYKSKSTKNKFVNNSQNP